MQRCNLKKISTILLVFLKSEQWSVKKQFLLSQKNACLLEQFQRTKKHAINSNMQKTVMIDKRILHAGCSCIPGLAHCQPIDKINTINKQTTECKVSSINRTQQHLRQGRKRRILFLLYRLCSCQVCTYMMEEDGILEILLWEKRFLHSQLHYQM